MAEHRQSQGLKTKIVALEQVYDEFSGGQVSSIAIKDFITHLLTHSTSPQKYLLIVGDGTYDPKGSLNSYGLSQMPVAIETGLQMDYGSDNFYVELGEQIVPQLSIGRIPTSDELEIQNYITKLIAYENGVLSPSHAKNNAFISGVDTINENFHSQIDQLQQTLSSQNTSLTADKISLIDYATNNEKKEAIQQIFNQDSLITTYYGHGAENVWDDSAAFNENDAFNLNNKSLPIVMTLNCLNAYYYDIDPNNRSIGENFILNPNGGAVAFWGSTSQTAPVAQLNLAQAFFNAVATATNKTYHDIRLGDLINQAKQTQSANNYSADTVKSWTLFGDPALKLPVSAFAKQPQPNPTIVTNPNKSVPSSGGGCSAFANDKLDQKPKGGVDILFILMPLMVLFRLRQLQKN